jgi:transcriptional regulator with GAF, ATPase, and Fis domain
MHDRNPDIILKQINVMTQVMAALPDIQGACRHIVDFIFEVLPAARAAILVNPRRTEREGQEFIAEVFRERGVAGPGSFTPRAEAIESACAQGKPYVSSHSPHIVCVPVIMPEGVRGIVYFESTGVDSEFIAEQTECIQVSATVVGSIVAKAEEIRDLEDRNLYLYEGLRNKYKMVGDAPAMRALYAGMRNAAAGDGPVLMLGEIGTEKS